MHSKMQTFKWFGSILNLGHTNVARILIEHGADVNVKDNDGSTPLILAAYNGIFNTIEPKESFSFLLIQKLGHLNVVRLLTEKGADVNVENNYKFTPLRRAAEKGIFCLSV